MKIIIVIAFLFQSDLLKNVFPTTERNLEIALVKPIVSFSMMSMI